MSQMSPLWWDVYVFIYLFVVLFFVVFYSEVKCFGGSYDISVGYKNLEWCW